MSAEREIREHVEIQEINLPQVPPAYAEWLREAHRLDTPEELSEKINRDRAELEGITKAIKETAEDPGLSGVFRESTLDNLRSFEKSMTAKIEFLEKILAEKSGDM